MSENELIVIAEVPGQLAAQILRGLLEAQGIPTILSQESAGSIYGLAVGITGNVQLLIPAEYHQQAESVMESYYAGRLEAELPEDSALDEVDPAEDGPDQG